MTRTPRLSHPDQDPPRASARGASAGARDRAPASRLRLLALLYLVALAAGVWGYAAATFHIFPHALVSATSTEIRAFLRGGEAEEKDTLDILTLHLQEQRNRFDFGGFVRRDPDFTDPGFLLLPRWSREDKRAVVELVRLADFVVVHRWTPDLERIADLGRQDAPEVMYSDPRAGFRMNHPLLLSDGGLVFSIGRGPLARIDRDSRVLWVRGGLFHHSLERDPEGHLVTTADIVPPLHHVPADLIDGGYAVFSLDGTALERHSAARILSGNGFDWLLLGMGELDPKELLHLNDVQPVHRSAGILERGDLLLSLRERSTVVLYRPATGRVIASRSGPWMMQHDPDPLADGRVAVFDNGAYLGPGREYLRHTPHSSVVIWDPRTGEVTRPFDAALAAADFRTNGGGQLTLLPNGDALVEESIWRRLLRVSEDRVRWEYVNAPPERPGIAGLMYWARYLSADDPALDWIDTTP